MKQKSGFSLMELLVTVVIIVVLVGVAVPQYERAILKSRFSTVFSIVQAISQGQELYYSGQREYAEDLADLDVSVPGNPSGKTAALQGGVTVKLGVEENHIYVRGEKDHNALMIYQKHSPNFAGERHCEAKEDDKDANWLCEKGMEGTFIGSKFGYNIYALGETSANSTLSRVYYNTTPTSTVSDGDECVGDNQNSCQSLNFNNQAKCTGNNAHTCEGNIFTNNSTCDRGKQRSFCLSFKVYSLCKYCVLGMRKCINDKYQNHGRN